jgi:hypothetical protein
LTVGSTVIEEAPTSSVPCPGGEAGAAATATAEQAMDRTLAKTETRLRARMTCSPEFGVSHASRRASQENCNSEREIIDERWRCVFEVATIWAERVID